MTEENKKRQENETIKDWLKRTSIKDDSWLKKAKHRQQTSCIKKIDSVDVLLLLATGLYLFFMVHNLLKLIN